jgi:hypothetical protein
VSVITPRRGFIVGLAAALTTMAVVEAPALSARAATDPAQDALIAGLVKDPASQTRVSLAAAYGHGRSALDPLLGIKGDGVSDDTAAINAALAGGDIELRFPRGNYKMLGQLNITADNVAIVIEAGAVIDASGASDTRTSVYARGTATTTIGTVAGDTTKGSLTVAVNPVGGFSAGDLVFLHSDEVFSQDRPADFTKGEWLFLESVGLSSVTFTSGLVDDYAPSPQVLTLTKILPIRGFRISGAGKLLGSGKGTQTGIYIDKALDPLVEGVTVESFTTRNIALSSAIGGAVTGCTSRLANLTAIGYGIQIGQTSRAVRVVGNHIDGCRHGIDTSSGSVAGPVRDIAIVGNTIFNCNSAGISTHGGNENATITGNSIDSCGGGIVNRGRGATIVANTILGGKSTTEDSNSYQHGIWLCGNLDGTGSGEGGTGCVVADNVISMGAHYGSAAANGISVTANMLHTRISGNIISGFSAHGIAVSGRHSADSQIVGNIISCQGQFSGTNTELEGIRLVPTEAAKPGYAMERLHIRGNTISSPKYSGVYIWAGLTTPQGTVHDVVITENVVDAPGVNGINLIGNNFVGGVIVASNVIPVASPLGTMQKTTDPIYVCPTARVQPMVFGNLTAVDNSTFRFGGDVAISGTVTAEQFGPPSSIDPVDGNATAKGVMSCNYYRVKSGGTLNKIRLGVAVQGGKVDVGIFRNVGTGVSAVPGARLGSSGAVVCPPVGFAEISLTAECVMRPGDWLAIAFDGAAASVTCGPANAPGTSAFNALGNGRHMATAGVFPLPVQASGVTGRAEAVFLLIGA